MGQRSKNKLHNLLSGWSFVYKQFCFVLGEVIGSSGLLITGDVFCHCSAQLMFRHHQKKCGFRSACQADPYRTTGAHVEPGTPDKAHFLCCWVISTVGFSRT